MSKFSPQIFCCVCGCKLKYFPKEVMIQKGMSTVTGTGQIYHHCNAGRHTPEQILIAINAVPRFVRASDYGKPIASTIPKPDY